MFTIRFHFKNVDESIDFIEKSSGVNSYNNNYSFELAFNVYAFPKNEDDINIIIKTSNKYGDLIEKLKIGGER